MSFKIVNLYSKYSEKGGALQADDWFYCWDQHISEQHYIQSIKKDDRSAWESGGPSSSKQSTLKSNKSKSETKSRGNKQNSIVAPGVLNSDTLAKKQLKTSSVYEFTDDASSSESETEAKFKPKKAKSELEESSSGSSHDSESEIIAQTIESVEKQMAKTRFSDLSETEFDIDIKDKKPDQIPLSESDSRFSYKGDGEKATKKKVPLKKRAFDSNSEFDQLPGVKKPKVESNATSVVAQKKSRKKNDFTKLKKKPNWSKPHFTSSSSDEDFPAGEGVPPSNNSPNAANEQNSNLSNLAIQRQKRSKFMRFWQMTKGFKFAHIFLLPVTDAIAPNYSTIIKRPMCLKDIKAKINNDIYDNKQDLVKDYDLMVDNCMEYNGADSVYYKHAKDFRKFFLPFIKNGMLNPF